MKEDEQRREPSTAAQRERWFNRARLLDAANCNCLWPAGEDPIRDPTCNRLHPVHELRPASERIQIRFELRFDSCVMLRISCRYCDVEEWHIPDGGKDEAWILLELMGYWNQHARSCSRSKIKEGGGKSP